MSHIDLQAAVTSWTAEALHDLAPEENLSYWISLTSVDRYPEVKVWIDGRGTWTGRAVPWPPDRSHVRLNVQRALERLGIRSPDGT